MRIEKELIKDMYLLQDYPEKDLEYLMKKMVIRNYSKGSYLFLQGDIDKTLHFIVKGKVKIFNSSEDGMDKLITIFTKSDFVGEMDIIGNNIERAASAQAITDVITYQLGHKDAIDFLSQTEIAFKIIETLSKRISDHNEQISLLIYGTAKQKLNYVLKNMKDKYGVIKGNTVVIEANISQKDIGNMVGISRETVSRYLNKLKNQGIVDVKNKKIIILDEEAFEEII